MDPFAGLKSEVFRPLASVVLPGLVAVFPFAIVMANGMQDVSTFATTHHGTYVACVLAAAMLAGLLLENIGTSVERGIDACMTKEYLPSARIVWRQYLECKDCDSNGRRFLGSIVTRMKFLNSFMPALFFFAAGIVMLQWQVAPWTWWAVVIFLFVTYLALVWMFRTSTELSEVAVSTQHRILLANDVRAVLDTDAVSVRRYRHFAYVLIEVLTSRADEVDLRPYHGLAVLPRSLKVSFNKVFSGKL